MLALAMLGGELGLREGEGFRHVNSSRLQGAEVGTVRADSDAGLLRGSLFKPIHAIEAAFGTTGCHARPRRTTRPARMESPQKAPSV